MPWANHGTPHEARQRVQGEGGDTTAGAESRADEQRGEGLPGHRHRGARHGHGELRGEAGEGGAADHERDVPDAGGGDQVGEDPAGAKGATAVLMGTPRGCERRGTS